MPVHLEQPVNLLTEQEFHDLDFQIMRWAFDTHNQLGRFYDEKIYQNELLKKCRMNGLQAETEVKIELTHKTFKKDLFIDLLLENSSIYELKATTSIISDHRIQTLDYLFLSNTQHGKIINFRPPSVEHEFISTTLDHIDRKNYSINEEEWLAESIIAERLRETVLTILSDWGLFLDTALYKEAICHFFKGSEDVIRPIEIQKDGVLLGTQKTPLISPSETFCISSVKNGVTTYKPHLQRFLNCTTLDSLYWINLNNSEVQLSSLKNKKLFCP